ncbi:MULTISPECIES: ABC transporter substrate-binding protein [unclassified Corynebacterium]|uniref:ABC transporter substrate-binding protein n=1 Tax=unclassified Corynebacterium TaxID=2624378 RepID=UPI00163DB353|nr:ABC transporter substrate-binding protein [Corynebacterium sp. SY003]
MANGKLGGVFAMGSVDSYRGDDGDKWSGWQIMINAMNKALKRSAYAAVISASLLLAGCGAEDKNDKNSASEAGVVKVNNCGYGMEFPQAPEKVLIMNGASVGEAESMISLGLGDKIIANAQGWSVSDISGMAEKVAALPKDNLEMNAAFDIPAEQVLSRKPDLVLSTYSGGFNERQGFASRETLQQVGIKSLVTPANCALGKTENVTDQEQEQYLKAGVEDSAQYLKLLGKIFRVEDRAEELVTQMNQRIAAVEEKLAATSSSTSPKKMLIVFPEMAAMNAQGLPAVMSGGIYDNVIEKAGGSPTFAGNPDITMTLSPEQLAAADVDVLIIGTTGAQGTTAEEEAQKLFEAYPQWKASRTHTFVGASDGLYLGPAHADAIEKIAKVAYPEAFSG